MTPSSLDEALQQELTTVIAAIDAAWRSGDAARQQEAIKECERMLAVLGEPVAGAGEAAPAGVSGSVTASGSTTEIGGEAKPVDPKAPARSTLWLKRGHLLEAQGTAEAAAEALESYGRAIAALEGLQGTGPVVGRAVAWMNRGNVLQRFRDERAWMDAVRCYDQALGWLGALASKGPVNGELASMLAAASMNRGAVLRQFGKKEAWEEALKSFEQALGIFQQMAAANPALTPSLVAAWGNRGEAKLALGDAAEAVKSHEQAHSLLKAWSEQSGAQLEPWDLGGAVFHLGQARAQAGDVEGGQRDLRAALAAVAVDEADQVPAAVIGLRARHALAVILGAQLAAAPAGPGAAELREAASDLTEEGLALAAKWEERGEEALIGGPGLGLRLYEFGAWLYRTQQPRFLPEFLGEYLGDPKGPRAQVAAQAIEQLRRDTLQKPLPGLSSGELSRTQAMLEGLRALEARIGGGTTARAAG